MAPLACAVEVTDVAADICIHTESLARSYERTAAAFTGSRDLSSARADAWIVLLRFLPRGAAILAANAGAHPVVGLTGMGGGSS